MRLTLAILFTFFALTNCIAQQLKYKAFTVNDGLPSNYVYRCIEDDKGFLWVATDAGIARFDGKHFQVFTTKEGLPDNEVLEVVKENNGRIWVACFKQGPAYFDEVQNRFISGKEDSNLAKVNESTSYKYLNALRDGGVMYYNGSGCYIFKDNTVYAFRTTKNSVLLVSKNADGAELTWGYAITNPALQLYHTRLLLSRDSKCIDSVPLHQLFGTGTCMPSLNEGQLYNYFAYQNACFVYRNISTNPIRFKADSLHVPETCFFYGFSGNWLIFYGNSGKMYVYDKRNLHPLFTMNGNYAPDGLCSDSKGNVWVSTIDKGLLMYKKGLVNNTPIPAGFSNINFLSIARKPDGSLLAGNFNGQVMESAGNTNKIYNVSTQVKGIIRIRKILISQHKIFTFSEGGINVNYTRLFTSPFTSLVYAKTAINYNDSIIITGDVGSLHKINSITEKISLLHAFGKRMTALAKAEDGMVYFGSIDGLYKYDYVKDTGGPLSKKDPSLSERITGLCTTGDGLLWVATADDGIGVVKNDEVIFHITEKDGIINNDARCIMAARPGQVWLGTGHGISIVNYKLVKGEIKCSVQNLSVNDGLSSNLVNEMLYANDTVYAATANGISVIPAGIAIPKFNIPVQLIRISISQRDTIIRTYYSLGYDEQNVQLEFAGIELSGHFKNLQYTINGNKDWINLEGNILTLQLTNGNHTVEVRAVDVNGNISDKILAIQFDVATPFWKSLWFWLVGVVLLQVVIFYFVNRWLKKKRELKLAKQIAGVQTAALEQQAFTSLMNPHFLFNALNSIQHYINVQDRKNANRYLSDFASLIRKNFEAAQQSFIPLEQEIENIKIYLRLEQMRFNDRFAYVITVDENVDVDEWMIPTMVLQPFLENALLHGIMPSSIDGKVTITFHEEDKNLVIAICDNGIGIANSVALKEGNGHKSRGVELIQKRIAALSQFGARPITINISPAFADEKNPGNKITLLIPAELHKAWLQAQQQ